MLVAIFALSACKSTEMAQEAASDAVSENTESMESPMATAEPSGDADVSVDDIIAKHIEARGGADNIKAVNTVKMTGKLEVMGMDVDMTNYIKRPDKMRARLYISSMDAEVNQGYDGEMGWMQNPGADPQPMPEQMSKGMKDQASIDGQLMDYADKGYTIEYVGEGMVNDNPAYKLKLMRSEQPESIIYIDKASYLQVKTEGEGVNPQNGQPMQTETFMSDFRSVDGIQMPFVTEVKVDGNTMQKMVMETIEVNVEVSDDLFMMPSMSVDIK